MQYGNINSKWSNPPVHSSWQQQAEENAAAGWGVPQINLEDNCYSMPSIHHSAAATSFPPPSYGMHSDTMTHNINLSITMGANMTSKPDGLGLVRYRAPDKESFIFDNDKGYRYDPTTGLHYDANSGFFINHELRILLRWDPLSNTYLRMGDLPSLRPAIDKVLPWAVLKTSDAFHKTLRGIERRSRSRSASSSKQPTIRQSRSRSVGRRGRLWHGSNSRDARRKSFSRSPSFHKTIRRRSRSWSASGSKKTRTRQSRSRSVGRRGRQWDRGNGRDARRKSFSRSPTLHETRYRRSRSQSASSSKKPRTRSRSRSSGRRGRQRHRSNNRAARRKSCSQSPILHKTRSQRSRSRSASNGKQPRNRQSRSISAGRRGRQRHRSNNRAARRKSCSQSPILHKTRSQRSRSRSASNGKQTRNRQSRSSGRTGMQRHRSNIGDASSNDSQMGKSCSPSPSLHKTGSQIKCSRNDTHHDGESQDRNKSGKAESKRDVWNRLGPSPTREDSRSREPSDSEREIQTSMDARTVRIVRMYNSETSRSRDCSRDRQSSSLSSADGKFVLDDECRDNLDNGSLHDDRAVDNTEAKPAGKNLRSIDNSPSSSQSKDVEITKEIKRSGSPTNSTDSQDSPLASAPAHVSTNLDSKPMPVNETPEKNREETSEDIVTVKDPRDETLPLNETPEKTREETSEVIVTNKYPRDETCEETPEVTIIDNGDILGHLFTGDSHTTTNIILVAPVPLQNQLENASDSLRNQIGAPKDILKVYVNYENTSGSPCRFMVISFKTAVAAEQWYGSLGGTIVLSGEDGSKLKGYLHFLRKGNWNCNLCKSFNFFMQSLCSKCYQAKGNGFSPITISEKPTKWVGIARLKSNFSTTSVTESLPPLHTFNILSIEMIREPSGLSLGLCVFEVESSEEGSKLHEFFLQQERNSIYVIVNEKPKTPDEEYLSLLFDKMTPANIVLVALIPLSNIPDIQFELSLMEIYLLTSLKEDGVKYNQITRHVDKNVGAPYSYGLITFADTETAAQWLKSRCKTLNKLNGRYQLSPVKTTQISKISLYFSRDNWECHSCRTPNFSLRSLCHRCFTHREQNRLSPISQSLTTTQWVAISELPIWSKTDEYIVAELRELLKEFILKRIEVMRDSECQKLPLACVFEMQGNGESLRLREYLTKEGMFSVFVVLHNEFDKHTCTDPSNVPDVMIVEAPPPECIDLTSEETTEIDLSLEGMTTVLEESRPECIDLTNDVNISHLPEHADTARLHGSTTPIVDQPAVSVNPASEAVLTQNAGISCSPELIKPVCEKQPPASMDVASIVMETTEKAPCTPQILKQSDVISVGPLPRLGENTQWHYAVGFLNYGAEYRSVEYCQGNSFGVSYNYCLVYFTSPQAANEWYNKCQGVIKITNKAFPDIKRKRVSKAYLHFSERNWLCDCGRENCQMRSICFGCFKQKGKNRPIFIHSPTPTKFLAIKLWNRYGVTELAAIFPKTRCMLCGVVNIKYISDPRVQKDNFGIYIVETRSLEGAIALCSHYKKSLVVQSTGFVVLKDGTAGTVIIDLGISVAPAVFPGEGDGGNTNCGKVACRAPAIVDKPEPDYAAVIWTSSYGFHLDKPPTNVVMISLCLEYRGLPVKTKVQIQDSLHKVGVTSGSISYSFKAEVGAPFSYCLVSFDSLDTAKMWFGKFKDAFRFEVSRPDVHKVPLSFQNCYSQKMTSDGDKTYFIKSKVHYSLPNWICNCGTSNFPLRSVCHACFKNKNKECGYSVSEATKFVGIKLTECLETVDISTLYDVRNIGYNVSKINIGLDPAVPRDPFGIVIFEMKSLNEGIKFRYFLADLASSQESGAKQIHDPVRKTLIKILSNSSGITFLIPVNNGETEMSSSQKNGIVASS